MGLAGRTEVRIRAHGTLVSDASNVRNDRVGLAKRSIAADTLVDGAVAKAGRLGKRLIDGCESVASVLGRRVANTLAAVVPIGAIEALVANSADELVTVIADGVMSLVTAGT